MSKPLKNNSVVGSTSYDRLNKYDVTLKSLQNQLANAKDMDELTIMAGKIIEIQLMIVAEKTSGYKKLEDDQKSCLERVEQLKKELKRAEEELKRVSDKLEVRVGKYKVVLQKQIDNLCDEYNTLAEIIGQKPE